tara:strand:- start:434 stop:1123 length:690 start_codon:yes stop_codon:yes gene_type:complete
MVGISKHSPGCNCCDQPPPPEHCSDYCSDSGVDEFDVTISSYVDNACDACTFLNNTFTLTSIGFANAEAIPRSGFCNDLPITWGDCTGAHELESSICQWQIIFSDYDSRMCQWETTDINENIKYSTFYLTGLQLQKFVIYYNNAYSHLWRLMIGYHYLERCNDGIETGTEGGFYYEYVPSGSAATTVCNLDGTESFTFTDRLSAHSNPCLGVTNFEDICDIGGISVGAV